MSVKLYHWNPMRPVIRGRLGRYVPIRRRVNNFGDLLGPIVVRRLLASRGIDYRDAASRSRLMSVGSVLHYAEGHDVVWGSGINGKMLASSYRLTDVDIRAVRGPRTRQFLGQMGIDAPAVYGDPALLVGKLWSRAELQRNSKRRKLAIVPNFHDWPSVRHDPRVVDPRSPLWKVIADIAASDLVVGSSLHGVILAESLNIPARTIRASAEPQFKYEDYYEGTGRTIALAEDVEEAVALGGQQPSSSWDASSLIDAFPFDLWAAPSRRTTIA